MKVIALTNQGGISNRVNLGTGVYSLVTKYNYTAECWTMDIIDASNVTLLSGIMLVPNIDLLYPYPDVQALIGTLMILEKTEGDYMNPDLLGSTVQLIWYEPTP